MKQLTWVDVFTHIATLKGCPCELVLTHETESGIVQDVKVALSDPDFIEKGILLGVVHQVGTSGTCIDCDDGCPELSDDGMTLVFHYGTLSRIVITLNQTWKESHGEP